MIALSNRVLLAAALLLFTLGSANAETRRLEIEIEPIIILNCIEQVDYTIDTATLLAASGGNEPSGNSVLTSSKGTQKIEARFAADSLLNESEGAVVEVIIENACSVRGLGRGEGFQVDVSAADQGRLVNTTGGGLLSVRDARGKPGYASRFTRSFSIPQNRIRLDTQISLDVLVRVDLQFANSSGRYSSPVDGVFSINVAAP